MPSKGTRNTTRKKTTQTKTQKSAKGVGKKKTTRRSSSKKSKGRSFLRRAALFLLIMIPLLGLSFYGGYLAHKSLSPQRVEKPAKSNVSAAKPKPAPKIEIKEPDYDDKQYAYAPSPEPMEPEKPAIPKPELPPAAPELKKVCIILDDFGYNFTKEIKQVLDLSPAINVAILPGQEYSRQIMDYARKSGHDIIVHAPFEGSSNSTEPKYIRRGESEAQVDALLAEWFGELPDAIGINNHQGSVATSDRQTMSYVISYLKNHNKIFVDSLTSPNSKGHRVARAQKVPHAKRTTPFLDNQDDRKKIRSYIDRWLAQAISRQDRVPVAIGHITKKNTRRILIDLVPRLQSMGYELAPISEVLEPRFSRRAGSQELGSAKRE